MFPFPFSQRFRMNLRPMQQNCNTFGMRKIFVLCLACATTLLACATSMVDDTEQALVVRDRKPDAGAVQPPVVSVGGKNLTLRPASVLPGDGFGAVMASSADGSVLVVGAPSETGQSEGVNPPVGVRGATLQGAAFVFRRSAADMWSLEAYLKPSHAGINGFGFGQAVAVSADGAVVAIGAPEEDSESKGVNSSPSGFLNGAGAAYVFGFDAGKWTQTAYIKSAAPAGKAAFGRSVALAMNGALLAVGTPTEAGAGRVYTYTRVDKKWAPGNVVKVPAGATGTSFGRALAMAENGDTLVVGADTAKYTDGQYVGAAHVFGRDSKGAWSLQTSLVAKSARAGEGFGTVLSLNADGDVLAAGIPGEKGTGKGAASDSTTRNESCATGAVYTYKRVASVWTVETYLKAARPACLDAAGGRFGASVTLQSGIALWVGAPGAGDTGLLGRGQLHSFQRGSLLTPWALESELVAESPKGGQGVGIAIAAARGQTASLVGGTEDGTALVFRK